METKIDGLVQLVLDKLVSLKGEVTAQEFEELQIELAYKLAHRILWDVSSIYDEPGHAVTVRRDLRRELNDRLKSSLAAK